MGISLPSGQSASGNTPLSQTVVNYFPPRASLPKKNTCFSISKWFIFLSTCCKHKGIFSPIFTVRNDELLEVNLTISLPTLHDWVPLELTFRLAHTELPIIRHLNFPVSLLVLVPSVVSTPESLLR